jgi:acetyl esterase/lipase
MLKPLFAAAVSLVLAGCSSTYFAVINVGGKARVEAAYGDDPVQRLDVWRAVGNDNAPIVVFVYGGRWQKGSRAQYGFVGKALAARGVAAVLPDFRDWPEGRFPTFVQDVAQAVRWARDHAREFGGDPSRIYLAGHSSGAHIAALVATDARYLAAVGMQPRDLAGVVGIAGPYDFLPITAPDMREIFAPDHAATQPVNFIDGDEPPFLLLHGVDDKTVWLRNSERLAAKLRAAGVAVELKAYPDLGHVRILSALRFPSLAPTLDDTVGFVTRR